MLTPAITLLSLPSQPSHPQAWTYHVHKSIAKATGIFEINGQVDEVILRLEALFIQKRDDLKRPRVFSRTEGVGR